MGKWNDDRWQQTQMTKPRANNINVSIMNRASDLNAAEERHHADNHLSWVTG
jgi:hypothetical protein